MQSQLAYPKSSYEPSALINMSDPAERKRLSPSAIRAFFNIMERWRVRDGDARDLLGGISNGVFYEMKRNPERVLDVDRLARISLLVGIFKSLNILYPEDLADAWITLPNKNRLFNGGTPLSYMREGGLAAMWTVRRLLDARRGGH
ncbi:MbcA/ParS/Xre antitoxin family protein [Aestuariivirga sp.]|uniref:MbcA/ParS/Xre antitoxin family protein n=1 Tax=Aestuariivirga sp. TaxID=2650926 RepID=UPI00391ADC3F